MFNITVLFLSESQSSYHSVSNEKFSTVLHQRNPRSSLDTHRPVICFPVNLWYRRRVVSPQLLTDDFLESSFVLTVFRRKSPCTLNVRKYDIIEVNCCLIHTSHVIQQIFSPEKKYLNTHPSSNRFRGNDFLKQKRIASHHRSRYSQREALICELQNPSHVN